MKIPLSYLVICPECGEEAVIRITDSWYFWLSDTRWRCPYCDETFSTTEIDKKEKTNAKS